MHFNSDSQAENQSSFWNTGLHGYRKSYIVPLTIARFRAHAVSFSIAVSEEERKEKREEA